MKVAVIPTIRDFPWGAPGHCMGELVNALLQAGHEVLWLVAPIDLNHAEVKRLAQNGAKVERLPEAPPRFFRFKGLRRQLRRWRQGERSLAETVAAFDPQHIFMNQGGTWCSLLEDFGECVVSRPGRYSLICHLNQPQPPFPPETLERARELMGNARKAYFPSAWTQRLAELQIAQDIPQAARFHYPVRFDFAEPLPWPQVKRPRVAMVCRLDVHHKSFDLVFQALAELKREGMSAPVAVYGTGSHEAYLRQLAGYLQVEELISFAGHAADLRKVWLQEEMLLLPSRFEGLAVSMTEAMGFGRPILTTALPGGEWVQDGVEGFICPAPDAGLLAGALRRAIAEHSRWPEMGRRAFERIQRDRPPNPAAAFLESLRA